MQIKYALLSVWHWLLLTASMAMPGLGMVPLRQLASNIQPVAGCIVRLQKASPKQCFKMHLGILFSPAYVPYYKPYHVVVTVAVTERSRASSDAHTPRWPNQLQSTKLKSLDVGTAVFSDMLPVVAHMHSTESLVLFCIMTNFNKKTIYITQTEVLFEHKIVHSKTNVIVNLTALEHNLSNFKFNFANHFNGYNHSRDSASVAHVYL